MPRASLRSLISAERPVVHYFRSGLFIFIFLLYLLIPKLNVRADSPAPLLPSETTISMDLQDASLKDILKIFSMQSGLNFIASEAVQDRKITLYLDKVPLQEAMDKLFKANNLSYEMDKQANIILVKDWGKPQIETITKVFYLKYATVSTSSLKEEMNNQIGPNSLTSATGTAGGATSTGAGGVGATSSQGKWAEEEDSGITRAVKKILSEHGSVIEDFRTNSLVITEIPSRMPIIEKTIAALDVPVAQVMLEVEMLDVSKNLVDKIGFKFGQTPFTAVLTGASMGTMWPFISSNLPFSAERMFTPGSLAVNTGTNTYTAMLDFLRTQTDTRYLARPRILTLNNETAEIKITTQETVGVNETVVTGTTPTTNTTPERVETGVTLRVTPQINSESSEITMFIMPTVKDVSTSSFLIGNTGSTYYKDPEERSTKSTVRVKDGETVVLGGLIRNEKTQTITKLPILGDLPLLGAFFRHKNKEKDKERELLVFITPHIVKDNAVSLAQAKRVNLPEREQGTTTAVNRQDIIATSLNTFEKNNRKNIK